MSKKHHKKQNRQSSTYGYGQPQAGYAYGPGQAQHGPQSGFPPDMDMPTGERGYGYEYDGCDNEADYNEAAYDSANANGNGSRQYGQGYGPGKFDPRYDPAYAYDSGFRQYGRSYGFNNPGMAGENTGNYAPGGTNRDFLREISSLFPSQHTDQFLMGLLIGAGAAWVLGDEEMRGKLIKAVMKVYAGVAGGFEELKEQMADIKAEVAMERHGDE